MVIRGIGALLVAAVVGAVATSAGCGSPAPCGLRGCDIRDSNCQRMVAESAACLRQVSPVNVPVTIIGRDQYISQQADSPLTPEQEQAFRTWNNGLALFGLAPKGQSPAEAARVDAGWVGAYYSYSTKSITVIADGSPLNSIYFVSLLVHENEHAIQDARFDIHAVYTANAANRDGSLAVGAMIEGEATIVGDRALVGLFGDSPDDVPWSRVFREWQATERHNGLTSPNPVTLAYSEFSYAFGTPYLYQAIAAGGWQGADDAFATPPSGARQVMAGFQAVEPAGGPWAEDLGNDAVPVLDARFSFQRADRMGAWIVSLLLGRAKVMAPDDPTNALTGDELSLFQDEVTGTAVAVWRLRFSSVERAQSVNAALVGAQNLGVDGWGYVRVLSIDRDLVLLTASESSGLDSIPLDLAFQAVPPPTSASGFPGYAGGPGADLRCPRRF